MTMARGRWIPPDARPTPVRLRKRVARRLTQKDPVPTPKRSSSMVTARRTVLDGRRPERHKLNLQAYRRRLDPAWDRACMLHTAGQRMDTSLEDLASEVRREQR